MKEKLTIGEFAKLRGVTTETLRYYDRIGLLKPVEVDLKTGYRFYSIIQSEKLGTIKELRQLGMSIEAIQQYFDERHLDKSIEILEERYEALKKKIQELKLLEKSIENKLVHLHAISSVEHLNELQIKELPERRVIVMNQPINNEIESWYAEVKLESMLDGVSPIIGTNRYGVVIDEAYIKLQDKYRGTPSVCLFITKEDELKCYEKEVKIQVFHKGKYACMYHRTSLKQIYKPLSNMMQKLEKDGYKVLGDGVQIVQIDISVTDQGEEALFELQLPIE